MDEEAHHVFIEVHPHEDHGKTRCIMTCVPWSPKQVILKYPRGAYTIARTFEHVWIFDIESHVERLAYSLSMLHFIRADRIVLTPHLAPGEQESEQVKKALSEWRTKDKMKEQLLPVLIQGIERYKAIHFIRDHEDPNDMKLTILVTWSFEHMAPRMILLVSPLQESTPFPCKIMMKQAMRDAKDVKDSLWVKDRECLEYDKPRDVNEIVLYDMNGSIYEGLSSNFFVLKEGILYTAPQGKVLWGTIQNLVIDLCQEEGIQVKFEYPHLGEIEQWQDAFITSTSRLVLPIGDIYYTQDSIERHVPLETSWMVLHLRDRVRTNAKSRAFYLPTSSSSSSMLSSDGT